MAFYSWLILLFYSSTGSIRRNRFLTFLLPSGIRSEVEKVVHEDKKRSKRFVPVSYGQARILEQKRWPVPHVLLSELRCVVGYPFVWAYACSRYGSVGQRVD